VNGPAAIQLDGLCKSYGGAHWAVAPTTLSIMSGEFITLLGPSGCGKTTTLGLIAGFVPPSGGDVYVHGEKITQLPTFLRDVGVVFQNYALFPHMSVFENVAFGLRIRRVPGAESRRRVEEALAMVRLADFGRRRPAQLSGGQQQRVALARALVIRPKILLLDEPLSALDKNLRAELQLEIRQIQRTLGITTILVTHDQNEALSMSDRIAVMRDGSVQQIDTPDDLYNRPANPFVASFVGEVNRIPVTVGERTGDGAQITLPGGARRTVPTPKIHGLNGGLAATLFVRPQGLKAVDAAVAELSATVGPVVFQGTHCEVHLMSEHCGPLQLRVEPALGPSFEPGQECHLAIAEDAISLLSSPSDDTVPQ